MPCLVDRNGVQGCYVGDLPEQCAALNRTNINVQLLTIEAALTAQDATRSTRRPCSTRTRRRS